MRSSSRGTEGAGAPLFRRRREALSARGLPSFSRSFWVCLRITSWRIFSLRRVSRKWAQTVRMRRSRAPANPPAVPRNCEKENWVARITETNMAVATRM